jgi:hypothetical protein
MIDLQSEIPLTFARAAVLRQLRRNGRPPATSTLWRWATGGCRGVRLDTVRVGGTLCTSEAAVLRFIARLNAGSPRAPVPTATPAGPAAADRR